MPIKANPGDYIGKKFGRWTVVGAANVKGYDTHVHCVCECGNQGVVRLCDLKRGHSKSCGCFAKKATTQRNLKHNLSNTRLFRIWAHMRARCYKKTDAAFEDYGGRGIAVCKEWKDSFQAFYDWAMANGYADELTLDRKDNDGDYAPDNCRWATKEQQAQNKRAAKSNVSGVRGVNWRADNQKWRSFIGFNGTRINLGDFDTIEEAATIRRKAEQEYWNK